MLYPPRYTPGPQGRSLEKGHLMHVGGPLFGVCCICKGTRGQGAGVPKSTGVPSPVPPTNGSSEEKMVSELGKEGSCFTSELRGETHL